MVDANLAATITPGVLRCASNTYIDSSRFASIPLFWFRESTAHVYPASKVGVAL
jgi:hypothetical protein